MRDLSIKKVRSAISNGSRLLPTSDGRLPWARRLRDLCSDITADLGGVAALSESEKVLIRRAAMLALQSELMELRFSQNEDGAATTPQIETYGRCTNTLRRTLETLGLERRARVVGGSALYDHTASTRRIIHDVLQEHKARATP